MNTLKYRLFELLAHHYGRFVTAGMLKLSEVANISYRTVRRDVYRQRGEGCIPQERLQAYADFFEVNISQIKNTEQYDSN